MGWSGVRWGGIGHGRSLAPKTKEVPRHRIRSAHPSPTWKAEKDTHKVLCSVCWHVREQPQSPSGASDGNSEFVMCYPTQNPWKLAPVAKLYIKVEIHEVADALKVPHDSAPLLGRNAECCQSAHERYLRHLPE